ncbi:hypothetical protein GQ42DRAFT_154185 [Ramicandelaber brevisporus]|nr:hypothetical protein GQ42DRAFT_154185 [Ramicandelaber brevisporus]
MSYLEETTISLGALLFQLPYELLELIAEWFTRSEAVPVLSVNSAFQELFASSVWRRLDNLPKSYWYTDKYNTQELRLDALCIYGRFVRRVNASWNLRIPDNLEDVFVCITHLWIPIDKLVRVIEGFYNASVIS